MKLDQKRQRVMKQKRQKRSDPSETLKRTGLSGAEKLLAKLKPKQRTYVEHRLKGDSKKDAALKAGYSETVALTGARAAEESKNVQAAFEALIREKIDSEHLVERLREGLDAIETQTFANVTGSKLKGTEEVKLTHVDKIAWTERRKYLELAAKMGNFFNEKLQIQQSGDIDVRFHLVGAE